MIASPASVASAPAVDHEAAAGQLAAAARSGNWLERLPEPACPRTLVDAYEIQERLARTLEAQTAGWKLGCTSAATQELLGCSEPIVGRILASAVMSSPARPGPLRPDMLFVEAEFSFRLAADLPPRADDYSRDEVAAAVGSVMPSIEIIQSRFVDWSLVSLPEIVADFAGHGRIILGAQLPYDPALGLADVEVSVIGNGARIAGGQGSNVLGDPVAAVHWLANFNSRRGIGLKAGELIAAGTCSGMSVVAPGTRVVAEFNGLGAAEIQF